MRIQLVSLIVAVLLAGHSQAQQMPAFYDVQGVTVDDVLNIRAAPDANAPVVATLRPDAGDIEVVGLSDDAKWGLVNTGEAAGYVSMRFLSAQDVPEWAMMGGKLRCGGTEPFWDGTFDASRQVFGFALIGESEQDLPLEKIQRSAGRSDVVGLTFRGDMPNFAVLRGAACSDGMSDRAFGISIDLFLNSTLGSTGYSGCCSLTK